jgi:hypothetical protein
MPAEFAHKNARFWLDEEGFLCGEGFEGAEHTLDLAMVEYANITATGKRYFHLMDISKIRSMSRDALAHYAGPKGLEMFFAMALVVGSPLSRVLGNFFLGLKKPLLPTRLFSNLEDARAWLREQRAGIDHGPR